MFILIHRNWSCTREAFLTSAKTSLKAHSTCTYIAYWLFTLSYTSLPTCLLLEVDTHVTVILLLYISTSLNNLICACMLSHSVVSRVFVTPRTVVYQAPLSINFPGRNSGVGCHALLQGIFLTQGSGPHLLHPCIGRQLLYHCATWEAQILSAVYG